MRVALLGCGWIAGWGHARAIPQVDSWEIVAVADPSDRRTVELGDQLGLSRSQCLGSLDEILARNDVEMVCILTPPHLHREQVELIARAGLHIACEKPFALNLADADAMLEAADTAGVSISVFHNHAYFDEHNVARRLIDEGAIGEVEGVMINGLGARPWSGAEEYRPDWRRDPSLAGGGSLMDNGIHALYLTEHYFQTSPSWVSATTLPRVGAGEVETYAYVQLGYPNGIASVAVGWGGGPANIEIYGRQARISIPFSPTDGHTSAQPSVVRVISDAKIVAEHPVVDREFQMFTPEIYKAIEERTRDASSGFRISGEQGREALELVLAAYASASRGHVVELPLRRDDPVYSKGLSALVE